MLYSKEHQGIVIKQSFDNTKGFISGLKTLNANIKKYMDRLTKQKTLEEIMEEFFGNYTKEVIDKAYHRLKISENVFKYRPKIIEKLTENLNNQEFLEEASEFFKEDADLTKLDQKIEMAQDIMHNIIAAFDNLDDIMHDIDSKKSKDMTGLVWNFRLYKQYAIKRVKEIGIELLQDKKMISAKDIKIDMIDDFIKIIYIRLYGNHHLAKYVVKTKDTIAQNNSFTYKNFEIWRNN